MARAPFIRHATGKRRRHIVRQTKYLLRSKGLNSRKQWQFHQYQEWRTIALVRFRQALEWVSSCAVVYMLNESNGVLDSNVLLSLLLAQSLLQAYAWHADYATICDSILADIPDNEDRTVHWGPAQNRRIADFDTDDNARAMTRFTKAELHEMLRLFAFPDPVYVRCGTFGATQYRFHPEELLIFSLTKIATGLPTVHLCLMYFGGAPDRWSYGYPYFLRYVDSRYRRVHTTQGLNRWVHFFPTFADAIQHHVGTDVARIGTKTREPYIIRGLQFIPPSFFRIFGFVDASLKETCTPETGPDGDYQGAPRKEFSDEMQRALYTGWKKQHGLKIQTVILPNGLSFIDGPYSMRE